MRDIETKKQRSAALAAFDEQLHTQGFVQVCGVDEAGRGPLAGPVYAAAVVLPRGSQIGVDDSKKLSAAQRERLFELITAQFPYAVASVDADEIDRINILQATFLAMQRAYEQLCEKLDARPDLILVDGDRRPPIEGEVRTVVKGDATSQAIAAASILAKVSRDRFMLQMAERYPQYRFEQHKGYGTKLHYEMLEQFGPCELHRRSFLKKWMEARDALR